LLDYQAVSRTSGAGAFHPFLIGLSSFLQVYLKSPHANSQPAKASHVNRQRVTDEMNLQHFGGIHDNRAACVVYRITPTKLVEKKGKNGTQIEIKENDQMFGQFMNCRVVKGKEAGTILIMRDDVVNAKFIRTRTLIIRKKDTDQRRADHDSLKRI